MIFLKIIVVSSKNVVIYSKNNCCLCVVVVDIKGSHRQRFLDMLLFVCCYMVLLTFNNDFLNSYCNTIVDTYIYFNTIIKIKKIKLKT